MAKIRLDQLLVGRGLAESRATDVKHIAEALDFDGAIHGKIGPRAGWQFTLQIHIHQHAAVAVPPVMRNQAALTRAQILVQSGTSVLGIANQNPQNVLSLLR